MPLVNIYNSNVHGSKITILPLWFLPSSKKRKENIYLSIEKWELYELLHFLEISSKFCDLFIYVLTQYNSTEYLLNHLYAWDFRLQQR